ncbi:hypothetical protein ColKHC_10651 [Colletotrichum higginsianum]|nr:hypothetical protein ColKHC_10651 [Colletotrichum higginsianum]
MATAKAAKIIVVPQCPVGWREFSQMRALPVAWMLLSTFLTPLGLWDTTGAIELRVGRREAERESELAAEKPRGWRKPGAKAQRAALREAMII